MDNSKLLKTTLKWNKIHDPRTGQFSAQSKGGQVITVRKRDTESGRGIGTGRIKTVADEVQAKANIAKAAVMPLSQFMQSSYVGPKNQRLDAMISEMPVGTTISGWTKIQGTNGAYWKKGTSTSLTLGSGVAGSSVHKAIISSAVKNGSLSAKKAVTIHSATYNNIASWAALRKILATKEIKVQTTYKAIAFMWPKIYTPKKKLQNEGKGFAGSKKIPRPEYGQETNYSMTGKPVPPPRLLVVSERDMMNKLSDAEKDRVSKMTGDTVVAAGSRWKKGGANGATIFQRVMQVFDNMRDYTKPGRPFLSGIKKYTHRNPVTKKENKGLWYNIRAKKKRGERLAKRGHEDYPDKLAFQNSAKTSKKELDKGEYDEEGGMAKSQLQSIIRNAKAIYDGLEDDTNISEWAQSKITVAEDYISTVSNYMQSDAKDVTKKEHARDYRKEYDNYHARPDQRANRGKRNQARRNMGLKVGDPREVDHKTPLSKNGGNNSDNLRAISFSENRKKGNKTLKELVSLSFKSKGVDTSIDKYDVLEYLEVQS